LLSLRSAVAFGGVAILLAACGGGGGITSTPQALPSATPAPSPTPNPASVLGFLKTKTTIASTVDPINGDQNPYGLAIAPAGTTAGGIEQPGDLIVCNFNNSANVQGQGTTIEDIKPVAGSTPTRMTQSASLLGCDAIAIGPTGNPWLADYTADDNPIVKPTGALAVSLTNAALKAPWGQAFSGTAGATFSSAFYESNAADGSIVRIDITSNGFVYDTIATGFSVNGGQPGNILAPAGLTYNPANDTLYIVDSNVNKVIAIKNVTQVPADGIQATDTVAATTFAGSSASSASVLYAGSPLNAPISAALLYNGALVVGNTANNLLVEISPSGTILDTVSVDSGAAGAIFGIAAEGTSTATTQIFFNDDNTNSVVELSASAAGATAHTRAKAR
jgi:hypothetical protein